MRKKITAANVKSHRNYTVQEAARVVNASPQTIRKWVNVLDILKCELLFGPDDALFPRQKRIRADRGFTTDGLSREFYRRSNPLNIAVQSAFENAPLPRFTPHSFRHILADYGSSLELSPRAFKA